MEPSPIDRALDALPHGPEFRFLDRLTRLDPGHSGAGEYVIPPNAPYLKGHFPGEPLMPAVLMIEAVAQLAGTVAQSNAAIPPLLNLRLTAVRAAKIFGPALPGQTLELAAQIAGRLGDLVQARGTASVNSRVLLEVDLVLAGESP
jgi:3-hydroxyacyl-[acyl-carrier-protein] dehydratase